MPENVTGFQPAENIKNQYISNSYQHLTHAFINLFPRRALILSVTKTRMIFLWLYLPELRIGKKGAFTDFLIRACVSHFRPCFAQAERAKGTSQLAGL